MHVLISGASIAGPALAYWLDRYGFDVTVVEKAPGPRPGGQAVDFKGRTHRTVLERMGVWEEVQRRRTGRSDTVYLDGSGRRLAVMSGEFTGGDVEILRGDIAAILYERTAGSCEYRFGDSITALAETAGGVLAEFEHGPARRFGLVVGADGIHSRVRRLAFGPGRDYVRHLGYYYCVAGNTNTGRFMAPRTALGIRARNWFLGSRAFGLMTRYGDNAARDIDLADYPARPRG